MKESYGSAVAERDTRNLFSVERISWPEPRIKAFLGRLATGEELKMPMTVHNWRLLATPRVHAAQFGAHIRCQTSPSTDRMMWWMVPA